MKIRGTTEIVFPDASFEKMCFRHFHLEPIMKIDCVVGLPIFHSFKIVLSGARQYGISHEVAGIPEEASEVKVITYFSVNARPLLVSIKTINKSIVVNK